MTTATSTAAALAETTTATAVADGATSRRKARKPRSVTAAASPREALVAEPPVPVTSKLDRLTTMLAHPDGTTLAAMIAATGWQAHSVRGALAGALRKRGLTITSAKSDGTRLYRADPAA